MAIIYVLHQGSLTLKSSSLEYNDLWKENNRPTPLQTNLCLKYKKTTDLKLFPTVLTTLSSQQLQHSCNGLNFISQLLKLCITKTRRKKDKNIESKRKLEPTAWVTGLARGKELDMELAKHLERKGKEKILEIFEKYSAIKITERKSCIW